PPSPAASYTLSLHDALPILMGLTDAEKEALELDVEDPGHRQLFDVPPAQGGDYPDVAYFAGNSLGLRPTATRTELLEDLDAWAQDRKSTRLNSSHEWISYAV